MRACWVIFVFIIINQQQRQAAAPAMPRKGYNDHDAAAHALLVLCNAPQSRQQDKAHADEHRTYAQYPATKCGCALLSFFLTIGYVMSTLGLAHNIVTQYVLPSTHVALVTLGDALVGEGVQCNVLNGSPLRLLQCTAISQLSYWWRHTLVGAEQYLRRIDTPMEVVSLICTAGVMGRLFLWQTCTTVQRIMCCAGGNYLTSCTTVYNTCNRILWQAQPPTWIEAESRLDNNAG